MPVLDDMDHYGVSKFVEEFLAFKLFNKGYRWLPCCLGKFDPEKHLLEAYYNVSIIVSKLIEALRDVHRSKIVHVTDPNQYESAFLRVVAEFFMHEPAMKSDHVLMRHIVAFAFEFSLVLCERNEMQYIPVIAHAVTSIFRNTLLPLLLAEDPNFKDFPTIFQQKWSRYLIQD